MHLKILCVKKGDMTQVPYWGPKNRRCHCAKFSSPSELGTGICAPLFSLFHFSSYYYRSNRTEFVYAECIGNNLQVSHRRHIPKFWLPKFSTNACIFYVSQQQNILHVQFQY